MMKEPFRMSLGQPLRAGIIGHSLILLVLGLSVACTKPNPRSCADGLCSDPAFPFCDADGALEGSPGTCIAVDCTPQELVACQGDQELRCNAAGNDLDVIECQLGCVEASGGCVTCSSNEQCDNPTPVCDVASGVCRECSADSDCESTVCDLATGSCLAEASIAYAAPTGNSPASCLLESPCSLARAVLVATGSGTPLTLRMLPGTYTSALNISAAGVAPQRIVATGATLSAGVSLTAGASVDIRNITIETGPDRIACSGSILVMRDSKWSSSNPSGGVSGTGCNLKIDNSEVNQIVGADAFSLVSNNTLTVDRLHAVKGGIFAGAGGGTNNALRVTNSLFEDGGLHGAGETFVAFSTFVLHLDTGGFICSSDANRIENNVIVTTTGDLFLDTKCAYSNNIVFPSVLQGFGSGLSANDRLIDPKFISGNDFHLSPTSPALDAALPSQVGLDTNHDLEGTLRPQGIKPDIGALERVQ